MQSCRKYCVSADSITGIKIKIIINKNKHLFTRVLVDYFIYRRFGKVTKRFLRNKDWDLHLGFSLYFVFDLLVFEDNRVFLMRFCSLLFFIAICCTFVFKLVFSRLLLFRTNTKTCTFYLVSSYQAFRCSIHMELHQIYSFNLLLKIIKPVYNVFSSALQK